MSRFVGFRLTVILIVLGVGLGHVPGAVAQTCGFGAGVTITGVVNTYYPGVSVNAARTQVTVDVANRFPQGPVIAVGDMILIIQMQDAQIDATNTDSYGNGTAGGGASGATALNNAGRYEFAVATTPPNGAGQFGVTGANPAGDGTLIRRYFTNTTPSTTRGQRTFQVIRVPQYGSASLGAALTAAPWNGRAGGVLAIDVSGTLTLNNATVSVDGLGFRGGVGRARGGTAGTAATDYRTSVTQNPNGMKGEGIAGTPDIAGAGADGYPNGDMARGAPATAGGGGTDGNPAVANDQNTGGGGGGNWGGGGQGGHGWLNNPNPCPPLATGSQTGGYGGMGVTDSTRLFLGSGAGAGSRNNAGPSGGGRGGGMILFRLGAASGSATLTARGTRPPSSANDGNGGGGAGGAIVVIAATGTLNGLSADVRGGQGGYANLNSPPAPDPPPGTAGSHHGPGGGGGGGQIRLSGAPMAPATTSVAGGASGLTNTCAGDNITQAYGATAGGSGDLATSWTLSNLEGVQLCTLVTRAGLLGLSWDPSGRVEFATGSQRRTRGFNVYGSDTPAGPEGAPLNGELLRAERPDTSEPTLYRADVGAAERYLWIEELETTGGSRFMGPYDREDDALPRAFEDVRRRVLEAADRRDETRRERSILARAGALGPAAAQGTTRGVTSPRLRREVPAAAVRALRIEVARAGVVRVPLVDLQALGLPAGAVALRGARLSLLGRAVPYRVESGALVFQAEAFSTDYTEHASYVFSWGLLAPSSRVPLTRSELPRRPGFVRVEENHYYAPYLPPDTDPWIWDVAVAGWGGGPWTFDLPGLQGQSVSVPLRLRVVGGTGHHHRVQALLNGASAGEVEFDGLSAAVLEGTVPPGVLHEAGNSLELAYESSGEEEGPGLLYLDALDLGVSVAPSRDLVQPVRIVPYDPLLASGVVDYLIVAPAAFRAAADTLAAKKRVEGLRARVVDLERVYDHYSAGVVEAEAIRALLADAYRRSRTRYALLLGDDTLDPRGYLGPIPELFVPSLNGWDGEFGRVPAENLYADVDGDGRPDLAIGRLPANTEAEAEVLVAKVVQQTEKLAVSGRQLFAVDRSGALDSPFRTVAEAVASRHFAGRPVAFADVGQGIAEARAALFAGLRGGAQTIHYFGHGGPEEWSNSALLTAADAADLQGTGTLALVFSWACEAQWFQYHLGPSVNEALLLVPDGGAVAAFGPAGISNPQIQRPLYDAVYAELARGASLGEAIRRGKTEALKKDPRSRQVVEGFNLLGDPALRLSGKPSVEAVLR